VRELQVERDCITWLNQNGFYAWKNASVGIYDEKTQSYRKPHPFQIKGVSDCVCISDSGVVWFIEFKAPNGVQSKDQTNFEAQIKKRSGNYIVVRSLEELKDAIDRFKMAKD
jgi:hypothetical protein